MYVLATGSDRHFSESSVGFLHCSTPYDPPQREAIKVFSYYLLWIHLNFQCIRDCECIWVWF